MAEPSCRKIPTRRRNAHPSTQPPLRNASIEGWIFDEERRVEFINMWKDKAIITPKFINSRMFIAIGFHFPSLSDAQDIKYFVEMHGS